MEGLMLSRKEEKRAYVLNGVLAKGWTVEEGARLLQISERHMWRVLARYRKEGVAALVHGNRGRTPANATPRDVQQAMVRLAQGPYDGANYSHMAEREGLHRSRWTVRRVLRNAGVGSPRRKRRQRRRARRERAAQEGLLLKVDGSRHAWLPTGGYLTLIGGVDDATGTVPDAVFREQEDAQGYLLVLRRVIRGKGVPLALYSDRHSIFVPTAKETLEEELVGAREPTQVGRALRELGVELILAHSPRPRSEWNVCGRPSRTDW
jgi:transposase